jgi:GTP-binding protein EngB required for normal cell division
MARARSATLDERLEAVDEVVRLGDGRLDPRSCDAAAEVSRLAGERRARGEDAVVVALCGGTGVGKSSLLNALAGSEVSTVGARRPVTTHALALLVGDRPGQLGVLDWLGVGQRHHVDPGPLPEGLCVIDLPDHDSVAIDHRLVVDRFVSRVDVLVWVVDPVKYAHRGLHDDFLRRFARHAEVVIVVLNHADELAEDEVEIVTEDLRRLLEADGLGNARVLATSAHTGMGVGDLRKVLVDEGQRRDASTRRLLGDVRALGDRLAGELDHAEARVPQTGPLTDALAGAVGVGATALAAAGEYRIEARRRSRSLLWGPFALLLGILARPLRGVRTLLGGRSQAAVRATEQARGATPVSVRHAALELLEELGVGLPERWQARLRLLMGAEDGRLIVAVRSAVDSVRLRPARRRWWRALAGIATAVDAVLLVGAVWLGVLGVLGWLRLPEPPTPMVTEVLSWPTALLLGGILARLVLAVVRRAMTRVGARRHRSDVAAQLRTAVRGVVEESVAAPLAAELDVLRSLSRHIAVLRS